LFIKVEVPINKHNNKNNIKNNNKNNYNNSEFHAGSH
jgi:hypothetical protein